MYMFMFMPNKYSRMKKNILHMQLVAFLGPCRQSKRGFATYLFRFLFSVEVPKYFHAYLYEKMYF